MSWLAYRVQLILFAWWFALIGSWFTGHRRRARKNLARVLDDHGWLQRARIETGVMLTLGRYAADMWCPRSLMRTLEGARLEGPGADALAQATKNGQPCILATAHLGNHLACIGAVRTNGYEVGILYRRRGTRVADRIFDRAMRAFEQPLFKIGHRRETGPQRGLGKMLRHLRRGGHVGLVLDQRVPTGRRLPFLKRKAWTSLSMAELAVAHNALLLPMRTVRLGATRWRFEIAQPITPGDPETMMRAYNLQISHWIREHPEQWFWSMRRW